VGIAPEVGGDDQGRVGGEKGCGDAGCGCWDVWAWEMRRAWGNVPDGESALGSMDGQGLLGVAMRESSIFSSMTSRRAQRYTGPFGSLVALKWCKIVGGMTWWAERAGTYICRERRMTWVTCCALCICEVRRMYCRTMADWSGISDKMG
jgi:hypothetical protein